MYCKEISRSEVSRDTLCDVKNKSHNVIHSVVVADGEIPKAELENNIVEQLVNIFTYKVRKRG